MAASSSRTSEIPRSLGNMTSLETLPSQHSVQFADQPVTTHDIFLSHSGRQKGFVTDLYEELSGLGFNVFFDITHHSLPLAESFPDKIFSAAKKCKLAVVVLSEQFVSSKWPMLELSAFVAAGVQILPLFFQLSPEDLKNISKLKKWEEAWKGFAAQDTRIKLTEWGDAIKALFSKNGLTFKGSAIEGETTYLRRVVSGICEIVPLAIKSDGPGIHGMDRLRQVILDKFEERESECAGKVSVLGLYGLPGSGKSTLCKCLCDHFFQIYGGRSLHLELPIRASTEDLVHKFKELLRLTDFRNRCNLDSVSELQQLFNLLCKYQLQRCRVFLVVDNISDDSWEAVQMFLRTLVLGHGSKVILVARTFHILQPAFHLLERYGQQYYIWDKMQMPSIQETEAIQILLQASDVNGTVVVMDGHPRLKHINLSPTQRENIVRIVRMCNFGSEDYPQYLPLVMKTMGAMMIKYDGNFARWGCDLQNFWCRVKTYKEKALKELVERSFAALPDEELQLLFLDLSLFILPLNLKSLEEVYDLLSSIYDGRSVTDIELMIKDLERHCFLKTAHCSCSEIIRVHDVYLEFAESISEDPSRFNSSIRYYWRNHKYRGAKDGKVLSFREAEQGTGYKHQQVRTMILEVQGDGYERVELQGCWSLKALVVRNCESLQVLELVGAQSLKTLVVRNCQSLLVFGFIGLSSLASLAILNCPNFRHIAGNSDLCNVKRLVISSPLGVQAAGDKGGISSLNSTVWGALLHSARFFKWSQPPLRSPIEMGIATKMRGLQDLILENTGISRLMIGNGSCAWQQLQNLTVRERYLEAFEVGNLPNLKCFVFDDNNITVAHNDTKVAHVAGIKHCLLPLRYVPLGYSVAHTDVYRKTKLWESKKEIQRFMLQGKGLLEGCPQLEKVEIRSPFFELGQLGTLPTKMVSIKLDSFYPARMLPDLSPSAHTLREVRLQWCEKLEKISFLVEFGKLTRLQVVECDSLVELTGLNFLFSLCYLNVGRCSNLRAILGPFHNLTMLQYFYVFKCPKLTGLAGADLENLVSIRKLSLPLKRSDQRFNLKNLCNLSRLVVSSWDIKIDHDDESTSSTNMRQLGGMLEGLEDLVNLEEFYLNGQHILHEPSSNLHKLHDLTKPALSSLSFSSFVGLDKHHAQSTLAGLQPASKSHFSSLNITNLALNNLSDLASMDGLQYLLQLKILNLSYLENLRSVQGLESLLHLWRLSLGYCPMLEELPSLHTLVELNYVYIIHCSKLKSVEGADALLKSGKLNEVSFEGCESLVHSPFSVTAFREFEERYPNKTRYWNKARYSNDRILNLNYYRIRFKDCKFAGIETMLEWAVNENMPSSIRKASFIHLHDKYRISDSSLREVLLDGLFPFLLNGFVPNTNDNNELCLDFDCLVRKILSGLQKELYNDELLFPDQRFWDKPFPRATVRELQNKVGGKYVAKKDVVQKFEAHPECKLLMLRLLIDELGFSNASEHQLETLLQNHLKYGTHTDEASSSFVHSEN